MPSSILEQSGWNRSATVGVCFSNHMIDPSPALRHRGAQFQLALTNFNYTYVAAQGWTATAELEKSYGRPPPEFALKTIEGVSLP